MALTAAAKQSHFREHLKAKARPARDRTLRNQRSRPQHDAVATLVSLRDHYSSRPDNLPETLHDTSCGEKLPAMAELDLDDLLAIEPPRGYRRN